MAKRFTAMVRQGKVADIRAACGQLRTAVGEEGKKGVEGTRGSAYS